MRAFAITLLFAAMACGGLAFPQVGVLAWTWIALLSPQQQVWGPLSAVPLNLVIACITFAAWALSKEPKRIPMNPVIVILLLFMAWMTVTTAVAIVPDAAWPHWSQDVKIMLLGLVIAGLMTTQVRIHALMWMVALCIGFFSVKGGGFTILTGGAGAVAASTNSTVGDNNGLALAMNSIFPILNYLRLQSERRIVRIGLGIAMFLTVMAVVGTYSRGGVIGLGVMAIYFWLRARQKVLLAFAAVVILTVGAHVMPARWEARMDTVSTAAEDDQSFRGRLEAWHFATNLALHRFFGGGFSATEQGWVFYKYLNKPENGLPPSGRAAHSIYFQVLGDHGFVGLAIYLALWAAVWWQIKAIRRRTRGDPQLAWAYDLVTMLQVSLVGYMVSGAALSMAYYDLLYIIFGVVVAVRQIVFGVSAVPVRPIGIPEPLAVGARRKPGKRLIGVPPQHARTPSSGRPAQG